jgi:hypothetical protein
MGRKKKNLGAGCLALFGLPFFLAGIFVFTIEVTEIINAQRAKDWLPVNVDIETLEVRVHSDSDSTTYSVETKYTYSFEGENYTGHRFSFSTGSDNVTDYQEQINRVRTRKPAFGFMNPELPQESVLIKDIPVTASILVPFGLVFMIVGLSLIVGGITHKVEQRRSSDLYKIHKQIRPSRISALLPIPVLTGAASFVMVFINAFVFANILDPLSTLYVTVSVLIIALGTGLVLTVRSLRDSKIILQIKTPPGTSRSFEVDVDFTGVKAGRKDTLSNTSANVDIKCQTQTRNSNIKKSKIATLGMKQKGIYQHSINFEADPKKVQTIDHLSLPGPDTMEIVKQMGVAMAGGPEAPKAKAKVNKSIEETVANLTTQLVLNMDKKKLKFQLPSDIWQSEAPG